MANAYPNRTRLDSPSIDDAVKLHIAGRLDEAEAVYRQALSRQPGNTDALHLLGVIAYQRRQYAEAEDLIGRAIALNKRIPDYRNSLGNVYLAQELLDKAEQCYLKALKLNPNLADARNNIGNVLKKRGKLQESIQAYQKALNLEPARAEIHNNLANVLDAVGRTDEAIGHYREAVRLKPEFADAHSALAAAYKSQGRMTEALQSCSQALQIAPSHALAFLNMGNVYSELGQIDKGAECFRRALRADPSLGTAALNLGHTLREQGEKEEAAECYRKAVELNPASLTARYGESIGQIPLLHDSVEEIAASRRRYADKLESLSRDIDLSSPQAVLEAAQLVGNCQPFFLAYQGENDRSLQSLYGNLMVRIQSSRFPAWSNRVPMPPCKAGEPLRIGIVSGFFWQHSNWKIPIKGWVENLNRSDFELHGYYTGGRFDDQTEAARRSFFQFTDRLTSVEQWGERIRGDRLHVLLYPEVGMDPMSLRLASLRLAPVQCTSWGHPDTSGLPTLDYYLSSDLMEPEDAQAHYAEALIRLPNLSIYYEPLTEEPPRVDRAHFGLSETAVLFLCAQSLFKYLPQFDDVFPRIASEVPRCQFCFLNYSKSPRLGERFLRRLESAFARHGLRSRDYVRMLPHLGAADYRALNRLTDVFLDSIGWSGCNSTLEALCCDLPIVTTPGKLMRGRHTHAILKMIGAEETEAPTIDEYVATARRLAMDADWRRHISERIAAIKHLAYRDRAPVEGLERFLKDAVARCGEDPCLIRSGAFAP